ncbi:hypothetical protein pb186bvf_010269 [Paramecium bursaria]
MHGKEDLDVPNLQLYPSTTGFFEHKKCFKQCVSSMETPYLSQLEEDCSRENCLSKHIQAQIFVSQKMTHLLTTLITQDPRIKMAFKRPDK